MSNQRLKLGLWTILVLLIGVLIATLLFSVSPNTKYQKAPEVTNTNVTANASFEESKIDEPDFVTISLLGDIMLDRGVENSVVKNFEGDFARLFENLGELKNSDIVFANLEGPVSDLGKNVGSKYSFRMDPSVILALKNAGISILSVANNHVGDWGLSAYKDTLMRLQENKILYTGGGENSLEAEFPTVIEKHGIKIGFLGFADNGPSGMEATTERAGFLSAKNPRFAEIIKNAGDQVDYLVVSFHFGDEYEPIHNARQEYLAHTAIDNGAKIVAGHHPHVIEDTEIYKEGFIAYSLGNFIFDQWFSTETMEGMWLEIKLSRDGSMTTRENIIKLNKFFQPDSVKKGEEEKIEFPKSISQ